MISSAERPLALILEDDVWLHDDIFQRLWYIVENELPCDWSVLSLKSRCPYGKCVAPHVSRVLPDGNVDKSVCRKGANYGCHGMLYRVKHLDAARRILFNTVWQDDRPKCLDVDVAWAFVS